jgi:hypothetical protein
MKIFSVIAILIALGVACSQPPVQTSAQSGTRFKIEKVVGGLEVPWSIVWAPDGRMIFTERPGRVRVFEKGALNPKPLLVVPDVETCDFIAGTSALDEHRSLGIRAVQSTPLFSRRGQLLGVISTHWRRPHEPSDH